MLNNLKALVVVLVLAYFVFRLLKPYALKFIAEIDYDRRRNVWFVVTTLAFVSNNFWIYCLTAFPVMFWAGKRDPNPVALYALLFQVIPPVTFELPAIVINRIFGINNYRLLSMAVLIPGIWRLAQATARARAEEKKMGTLQHRSVDYSMLLYLLLFLQLGLELPYEDFTNTIRRGTLFMLDYFVLVYLTARSCNTAPRLKEVVATFCLTCALFIPAAVFEAGKGWLLFTGLANVWGAYMPFTYLMRGDALRAQVSTGHSLSLGYLLSVGFSFWLMLASEFSSQRTRVLGFAALWVGMFASFARASWVASVLSYISYCFLRTGGLKQLLKAFLLLVPVVGVGLMTPYGQRIAQSLPFIGTVDAANVVYRQKLGEASWDLITQHPWFGDPFFMRHLEFLRQGQGIIDLVNVYAFFAMEFGIVGLILFLMPYLLGLRSSWTYSRRLEAINPTFASFGMGLLSAMVGSAFFLYTGAFDGVTPIVYYLLIGLAAGYAGVARIELRNHAQGIRERQRTRQRMARTA